MLRRVFILLARLHYSDPSNYGPMQKAMKQYTYAPEGKKGTVNITLEELESVAQEDFFPAIQVAIEDVSFDRNVLGDVSGNDGERGLTAKTALSIHHCSQAADEAAQLAGLTAVFFAGIGPVIQKQLNLLTFIPARITKPVKVDSSAQQSFRLYRSTFQATIAFDYSWVTQLESHLIRTATVEAVARLSTDLETTQRGS